MDIKTLMHARFVPPSYRKELLLKLQRLHQGPMCVSEYFKELKSQMFMVGIKETNKEKIKRFVNGLRRETMQSCMSTPLFKMFSHLPLGLKLI